MLRLGPSTVKVDNDPKVIRQTLSLKRLYRVQTPQKLATFILAIPKNVISLIDNQ